MTVDPGTTKKKSGYSSSLWIVLRTLAVFHIVFAAAGISFLCIIVVEAAIWNFVFHRDTDDLFVGTGTL